MKLMADREFFNLVTFTPQDGGQPIQLLVEGEVQLTPGSTVTLGAVSSGTNLACQVNISLRVFQMPVNPAGGVAGQTDPLTRAALLGANSGLGGSAGGAAQSMFITGGIGEYNASSCSRQRN